MTESQIFAVEQSFAKVRPIAHVAADLFYARLFETAPSVRAMFPDDMAEQKRKLMAMLGAVVGMLRTPQTLIPAVEQLGKRHVNYGTRPEHFGAVGAALLWTLEQGLGNDYTTEVADAWTTAFGVIAERMTAMLPNQEVTS